MSARKLLTNVVVAGGLVQSVTFDFLASGDLPAGTGTVTSFGVTPGEGVTASVANPTTTPALTIGRTPATTVCSGATAVTSGATTALTYTASRDDLTLFNGSTKFTAATTGIYLINSYTHWPANGAGFRIAEVRLNGATYLNGRCDVGAAPFASDVRQEVTAVMALTAGDYVELAVFQDSGSTLTPTTQTFVIVKIG